MSNIALLTGGEMDKSQELYSREGDNSSGFERKTVAWEHTIPNGMHYFVFCTFACFRLHL